MDSSARLNGGVARTAAPPRAESIDIRTADGWTLRADLLAPAGRGSTVDPRPMGVAVLAHALMARRIEFDRPMGAGLARFLADRGWSTIAFDFRGHGDSRPSGASAAEPRYDDFVAVDLPAVCDFARWHAGGAPVLVVGHSLGGHAALAAAGCGAIAVDGVVGLAAAVWLRELEPSPAKWLAKRIVLASSAAIARRLGSLPARALRIGSDDETGACVEDLERFARTGVWASADGRVDYLASLADVRCPVLQVVSDGDWLECAPECGLRFVARCGGSHEVLRVTSGDDGSPAPSHMALVTGGRSRAVWQRVEAWMAHVAEARRGEGHVRRVD